MEHLNPFEMFRILLIDGCYALYVFLLLKSLLTMQFLCKNVFVCVFGTPTKIAHIHTLICRLSLFHSTSRCIQLLCWYNFECVCASVFSANFFSFTFPSFWCHDTIKFCCWYIHGALYSFPFWMLGSFFCSCCCFCCCYFQ